MYPFVFQCLAAHPDMEIYICPNWLIKKLPLQPPQQIHAGYLFSALFALLFVFVMQWIPHVCLMRVCFGIPCPGCGITHSLKALATGHWQASRTANPAGLAVGLCFVFQLVARPLAIAHIEFSTFVHRGSRILGAIACGVILIHWLFQLFLGRI